MRILPQNTRIREVQIHKEQPWTDLLASAISDPKILLETLNLPIEPFASHIEARRLFAMRVPLPFVEKMEKGNPKDPLFLQVMTVQDEFLQVEGFSKDPLEEQETAAPNILHKYHNRLLLMVKGGCAVNCRYCFRRHFPYGENKGNKSTWLQSLAYIEQHPEIEEVVFFRRGSFNGKRS